MPNPKTMTPQQIAQYYVSAFTIGENTQYTRGFDNLVSALGDELKLSMPGTEKYQAIQNLLTSLNGLKTAAQNAIAARRNKNADEVRQQMTAAETYAGQINAGKEALKEAYRQYAVDHMEDEKKDAEDEAPEAEGEAPDPVEAARAQGEAEFNSRFEDHFDQVEAEAQVKSAEEWIADAQADFNNQNGGYDTQIARIIAARQLGSAGSGGLKGTQITNARLDAYAQMLLNNIDFSNFLDHYKTTYNPKDISANNGKQLEDKLNAWVKALPEDDYNDLDISALKRYKFKTAEAHQAHLNTLPKGKTAAQAIEEIQNKHRYNRWNPSEQELAGILAARQLANARRGRRGNLDRTLIDQDTLDHRADALIKDPTFQAFIRHLENTANQQALDKILDEYDIDEEIARKRIPKDLPMISSDKLTNGHGGEVEDAFEEFLKVHLQKEENREGLNPDIYDRYLIKLGYKDPKAEAAKQAQPENVPAPKYTGYGDYFEKNGNGNPVDMEHASKMAAANHLRRRRPDDNFDEQLLNDTAKKFQDDPAFRFVMRDKNIMRQLCEGNADAFALQVKQVKDDFTAAMHPADDEDIGEEAEFELSWGFNHIDAKLRRPSKADVEKTAEAELPKVSKKLKEEFDAEIEKKAQSLAVTKAKNDYIKRFRSLNGFEDDLEATIKIDDYAKQEKERLLAAEQKKYNDNLKDFARSKAEDIVRKKRGMSYDEMKKALDYEEPAILSNAEIEKQAQRLARTKAQDEYKKQFKTLDGFDDDLEVTIKIDDYARQEKERLLAAEQKKYNDGLEEAAKKNAEAIVREKRGMSYDEMEEALKNKDQAILADIQKELPAQTDLVKKGILVKKEILADIQKEVPAQIELTKKEYMKKGFVPGVNTVRAERLADGRAQKIEEQKRLAKRGPKFRNMMESVKQLREKKDLGMAEPTDLIKTVNSILEYQDGKEKGFFSSSKNQRFNDSMTLLAEVTVGTPAEKYYRQQLDKVNAARGLAPGSRGYLKPEDFLCKEPEAENAPQNEAQEQYNQDLYNRIKNLSFGKNEADNNDLADNNIDNNEINNGNAVKEDAADQLNKNGNQEAALFI